MTLSSQWLLGAAQISKDAVVAGGDFLNYAITWEEAEDVFGALSRDGPLSSRASDLFAFHKRLGDALAALVPNG